MSSYQPTNGFMKWFHKRLPAMDMVVHFRDFPTPRNLNYWWTFGAILSAFLVLQIVTGIVLVMHYTPHVDLAFDSIEKTMRDVNYGWMLRYMHANGASMFFVAVYVHIFRGIYYGSYKAPRELVWIVGVVMFVLMMASAFLGYVLPWGQMSGWGATVITNLFSAIPLVGENIVQWLWGGFSVANPTLNRFFSLHYLLPLVLAAVVAIHIWAFHVSGNNNPTGLDVKTKRDTLPFHPYYTLKDTFAVILFCLVFVWFVFFTPNILGHPDNYTKFDNLVTPSHIVPEWYFLPFYAILRGIPSKLFGVIAMFASIGILLLLPWLDTSKIRSARYRPVFKQVFWLFLIVCLALGWAGAQPADGVLFNSIGSERVFDNAKSANSFYDARRAEYKQQDRSSDLIELVQKVDWEKNSVYWRVTEYSFRFTMATFTGILTTLYFLFFLSLPLISRIEKPSARPKSIADDVMGSSKSDAKG